MVARSPLPSRIFLLAAAPAAALAAMFAAGAQETAPAEEILATSIAHHDPGGLWSSGAFQLEIAGTRPIAGPTMTTILIDNAAGSFHYKRERFGSVIEATVTGDECVATLDGESELTAQQIERFGLACESLRTTRDYHLYLYGLPMKLRDPGAHIDPQAVRTTFQGRDVWQLRVSYDPEVGTDTWHFYFDPAGSALVGYRFDRPAGAGAGEYIVLDREIEGGGLRLPKVRSWFGAADHELLGTDTIRSITRLGSGR